MYARQAITTLVLLLATLLTTGCHNKAQTAALGDFVPSYTPQYASHFSLLRSPTHEATILRITNPWQGAEHVEHLVWIGREQPPQWFRGTHIDAPQRIVVLSSSYVAMLEGIGCQERIVGVSGVRFMHNARIREREREGTVADVGYGGNLDFEAMKSRGCDLVLLYGVSGQDKQTTSKLDQLDIPYIYIGEYVEEHPLGKAEWVVAMAAICGCHERGEVLFGSLSTRYNAIRNSITTSTARPKVMLNIPYRDIWYMPSTNSYMVHLIADAGGDYIYPQNNGSGAEPISIEQALMLCSRADVWLNMGDITSFEQLRAQNPRFAGVECCRTRRIYNNNKKLTAGGGSDFWESGIMHPDLILEDLHAILHSHPTTEQLHYYRKIE